MRSYRRLKEVTAVIVIFFLPCLGLPSAPAIAGWAPTRSALGDPRARSVSLIARTLDERGIGPAESVCSVNLDLGHATLSAGATQPEELELSVLARTWSRRGSLGLLALRPGELPAAEDPDGILAALADMEGAGNPEAAVRGYEAFLRRWPGDWRGAFGWGNALHATGNDLRADNALRRAHGTAPERPEPLNNLALLSLAAGRREEAQALARMALDRAESLGIDKGIYEDTASRAARVSDP